MKKEKKQTEPNVLASLSDVAKLEKFVSAVGHKLFDSKLKPGSNILAYAKAQKLKIPDFLEGAVVESIDHENEAKYTAKLKNRLVLVRPNKAVGDPMAIRIGCKIIRTRWGTIVICLECGWIWCRIVIYF
jgi:hypothetical protein